MTTVSLFWQYNEVQLLTMPIELFWTQPHLPELRAVIPIASTLWISSSVLLVQLLH